MDYGVPSPAVIVLTDVPPGELWFVRKGSLVTTLSATRLRVTRDLFVLGKIVGFET